MHDSNRQAPTNAEHDGCRVESRLVSTPLEATPVAVPQDEVSDRPWYRQVTREQWNRWLSAMRPIEPLRFVGRAAPASILFQSGRYDRLVPPADAVWLHRAASEPKTVKWYDAGHGLGPQAQTDQVEWLHRTVGLDLRPRR